MPVLKNAQHERFAQVIAEGKSATEAYAEAGYKGDRTAASRLSTNVNIVGRVKKLQSQGAERTLVSIASLTNELEESPSTGYGGRSSSKTWDAAGCAIFLATQCRIRVLCARQFQNKIVESVYTLLKIQIGRFGLTDQFVITENSIKHKLTGSGFMFYGLGGTSMKSSPWKVSTSYPSSNALHADQRISHRFGLAIARRVLGMRDLRLFQHVPFYVLRHKTKTAIRNAASDAVRNEISSLP